MRRLTISNFSCIDYAQLELGRLTVIVGPQASGKSVICKLMYFCISLLQDQYSFAEEQKKLDSFKTHIRDKFREWFPVTAWGKKKFCIDFEAGDFQVRLTRVEYKGRVSDNLRVSLSPFFEEQYQSLLDTVESLRKKSPEDDAHVEYDIAWRLAVTSEKLLAKKLGRDFVSYQLFVPAGRSFFTSIGKAVFAFEQSRMLDPLTSLFGRIFAAYRERHFYRMPGKTSREIEGILIQQLFGGNIKLERDREYVETPDGRKVPFSALSSGQQELLPLLIVLGRLNRFSQRREQQLIYIEEPEAHLFPSAQNILMESLAGVTVSPRERIDMVLTTHSPYVLAKVNNLIKAGDLSSKNENLQKKISQVIQRRSWLPPGHVKAYAISNRELKSILDNDGLINADYLDDVSGAIAREFSRLMEIEVNNEA